ncbi:hypothetical protein BDN72DRAFT_818680 [Pluteus cervinus]|uniref:Uncharacterized protein n=1 Tax=Pluteus cervinus TaxID=181527 RepID=A0ACD3AYV6_9AGAR|nr:hypothetical protein BDN72DRAFT_818680 [Pluteus cervinus]
MLFFLLIASAYKAYAAPTPLGPEVFSSTPLSLVFGRSAPCNCGPQDRSLNDIVRSCVLTIFACIYTALHPNIPDPEAKMWKKICMRLKMSFYMLIAPEAVIWWAMRQWYGARRIAKMVNELNWTTTHGHFVQMGGLEAIHPDGRREVLNAWDLCSVWAANYLWKARIDIDEFQFPKKQLQDRSKGDFLSKGLVALQTSWFVLECIARFQQHLPITELEVITLAFAVLNVITYGFWWDKPLNVNCQVQIHIKPEVSPNRPEANESRDGGSNEVEGEGRQVREASNIGKEEGGNDVIEGGNNHEGSQLLMTPMGQDQRDGDATTTKNGRNQKKSSTVGKRLLRLPRWPYDRLVVRPFTALVLPIQDMFKCEDVEKGARHVPMFYGFPNTLGDLLRIRLMSCLIGMIFAGIHFIAWDSHFPTHVELLFWRSASLVVLVVPFLVGLLGIVLRDYEFDPGENERPEYERKRYGPVFTAILRPIRWVLYILGPILYILARVSLIVQALISLRDLQPTVFQNIAWTSYIPHL